MTQVNTERPKTRFHNFSERINAPLPGEVAMVPSTDAKYAQRDPAFRPLVPASSARTSTAPAKPMAAAPVAPKPTAADIAFAAKTNAKYRHAKVMESPHVKGRECQAEAMLLASCTSGSKYAEAKTIITALASSPLDAQLVAVERHLKAKAVNDTWARAYSIQSAQNAPEKKPEPKSKQSDHDATWEKARSAPDTARSHTV